MDFILKNLEVEEDSHKLVFSDDDEYDEHPLSSNDEMFIDNS